MKMETQPKKTQPTDKPTPEQPAQDRPFDLAQDKPAPPAPAKPQMGRLRRFWRATLIWLAVIAVAFLAGILTFNYMRYKPLNERLVQAQGELSQATQSISDLEAKLAVASDKVTALEHDNQALHSELDAAQTHLELLQVLAQVNNARLALVDGDIPEAKAALENTSAQLEALAPRIAEVNPALAESMPQRLALILSGLEGDVETAKVDLELLTGNLLDAETALFGE